MSKENGRFSTLSGCAPHVARKCAKLVFRNLLIKVTENRSKLRYDIFVVDKLEEVGSDGKQIELKKEDIDWFLASFTKGTMNVIVIPMHAVELHKDN